VPDSNRQLPHGRSAMSYLLGFLLITYWRFERRLPCSQC
jgi:hypothetical protein